MPKSPASYVLLQPPPSCGLAPAQAECETEARARPRRVRESVPSLERADSNVPATSRLSPPAPCTCTRFGPALTTPLRGGRGAEPGLDAEPKGLESQEGLSSVMGSGSEGLRAGVRDPSLRSQSPPPECAEDQPVHLS